MMYWVVGQMPQHFLLTTAWYLPISGYVSVQHKVTSPLSLCAGREDVSTVNTPPLHPPCSQIFKDRRVLGFKESRNTFNNSSTASKVCCKDKCLWIFYVSRTSQPFHWASITYGIRHDRGELDCSTIFATCWYVICTGYVVCGMTCGMR